MWFEVRTPDRSDLFLHFRQSPSPASFWLKYKITVVCAWLALFAWLFHFGPAVRAWAEFWRFVAPYLSDEIWSQSRFATALILGWAAVVTKTETSQAVILASSLITLPAAWAVGLYTAIHRKAKLDIPIARPLVEVGDRGAASQGLGRRKRRRIRWLPRHWRMLWVMSLALFLLTWGSNLAAILLICACAFLPLAVRACVRCFDLASGAHRTGPLGIVHLWLMVGLLVDSLYREQLEAEKRVHGTRGPAARPLWQVGLGLSVGLACLWKALYVLFRWHSKRLATGLVFVQYVARVGTLAVAVVVLESLVIRISVGATLIRQSDATLTAVITIFPGLGVASTTLLTPALGIGLAVARWLLFGVWLSVLVPMFGRSQASTIEQLESKRAILRKAWFLARLGERTARKVLRRLGSVGNDGQSG